MSHKVTFSTSGGVTSQRLGEVEGHGQTKPADDAKKVARYYNSRIAESSVKPVSYASSVVSSQEMMLANLRYTKQQLDKEDKALARLQAELFMKQYPRKWNNPRHLHSNDGDEDMLM